MSKPWETVPDHFDAFDIATLKWIYGGYEKNDAAYGLINCLKDAGKEGAAILNSAGYGVQHDGLTAPETPE